MARLIVSGTLSIPEVSSCSLISRLNSANFVSMTSMSPKLKFITLIKSVCVSALVSQHEASVRFVPGLLWCFSHHFSRSFCRQQCQDIVERPRTLFPSFVRRDSLHPWVCCYRLQLRQQRAVHRSHEARQRKAPVAVLFSV